MTAGNKRSLREPRVLCLALSFTLCLVVMVALLALVNDPARAWGSTLYVAPDGDCGGASPCYATIQGAVDAASDGDIVKVAQGVYTGAGFQVVYISKAITMTGGYAITDWLHSCPLTQTTVLDAGDVPRRRGVFVDGTDVAPISLGGLRIEHGYAEDASGGGVYILSGTVTLRDCQVLHNRTSGSEARGGGIYAEGGSLYLSNSLIVSNTAYSTGGVYVRSAAVLNDNIIQGNAGGGAYLAGPATVSNNIIQGNAGGGVYLAGPATVSKNTIQSNSGGGVHVLGSSTLDNNTIQDNSSYGCGGGAQVSSGSVTLVGNAILDNIADRGGGICVSGSVDHYVGTVVLRHNTIQGNSATSSSVGDPDGGGGVYVYESDVTLSDNLLQNNHANADGGGVYLHGGGYDSYYYSISLLNNMIVNNLAEKNGGGVYVVRGRFSIDGNIVISNTARMNGGGMSLGNGWPIELQGNHVLSNTAELYGGGIAIGSGGVNAQNDAIVNNTSTWEGVYVSGGTLGACHWTLANNGDYALTTNGGTAILTNTIAASHTLAALWGSDIRADHTLLFNSGTPCGGGASCANNLFGDPDFANPTAGDYHIGPGSAAIDAGIDAGVLHDMDHQPRFGIPDLGADEYWAPGVLRYAYLPMILKNYP